eukprot:4558891-Pyramimonas_sp.AAC.1
MARGGTRCYYSMQCLVTVACDADFSYILYPDNPGNISIAAVAACSRLFIKVISVYYLYNASWELRGLVPGGGAQQ